MACEKHGYTNPTFCPACDLETIEKYSKSKTIHAKHEPYEDGHLGDVYNDMLVHGEPTIRVVEFEGELFATEGSHRLAVANHLGLPVKVVIEETIMGRKQLLFGDALKIPFQNMYSVHCTF